jgi:hypothetical protein
MNELLRRRKSGLSEALMTATHLLMEMSLLFERFKVFMEQKLTFLDFQDFVYFL